MQSLGVSDGSRNRTDENKIGEPRPRACTFWWALQCTSVHLRQRAAVLTAGRTSGATSEKFPGF